jgi:hypothetical protein
MLLTVAGTAMAILFVSGLLIRWWPKSSKGAASQLEKNDLVGV